jgi:hypothetical protein
VHGLELPEPLQVLEHARCHEVAGVEDQVGLVEPAQAVGRQLPLAAWQMGVGDDRDERQRRRGGVLRFGAFAVAAPPTRKARPT